MTWTDTSTIQATAGAEARAADFNAALGNLAHIWDEAPRITVRLTSDSDPIASASNQTVQWDEAAWDSTGGNMWDSGTPGSIVVPAGAGGLYLGVAQDIWEGTSDDNSKRDFAIEKNGTDRLALKSVPATSSPGTQCLLLTSLAANDYLEVVARQLSGSSISLKSGNPGTRFTLILIGADPSA